jgi:poly-beta-1,6-N-acetyl-D-glucosamine synthase
MKKTKLAFILITPAHNEEAHIEETIKSIISQKQKPRMWIIVNDGSTDKTNDIIHNYILKYPWIRLICLPEHHEHHFAAKVIAFNAGYRIAKNFPHDIIGNLDADISFDDDFFEYLVSKFNENINLGVAGTGFIEGGSLAYNYNYTNIHHVSGQCQIFRRECFEDIGGYCPIKEGGIDWVAVTTARMKGWETRTFQEKHFIHHRQLGTGKAKSVLWSKFDYGRKDYFLGNHPLWELFRILYQIKCAPPVIGGLLIGLGYLYQAFFYHKRPVSRELVRFHQKEQMIRLKKIFKCFTGKRQ